MVLCSEPFPKHRGVGDFLNLCYFLGSQGWSKVQPCPAAGGDRFLGIRFVAAVCEQAGGNPQEGQRTEEYGGPPEVKNRTCVGRLGGSVG